MTGSTAPGVADALVRLVTERLLEGIGRPQGAAPMELTVLTEEVRALRREVEDLRKIVQGPSRPDAEVLSQFASLTLKQHATLQMLLRGAPNAEIADRLAADEGTVKGTVKAICNHLGLQGKERTRHHIRVRVQPIIDNLDASEYHRIAGVSKDWDATWSPSDRQKLPQLYAKLRKAPVRAKRKR